jgi:hypothetical protein
MDRRFRIVAMVSAVLVAAVVGVLSYDAGVAHGIAISPALANAPVPPFAPYWAYRPWGWGFGFGPVFFLLFVWFVMFRTFAWSGVRRRGWYRGGPYEVPPQFDEWHRRAHEGMNKPL